MLFRSVHAGSLEASADGDFAACFNNSGGSTQTPGMELWIAHAMAIAVDVLEAFASLVAMVGMAANGA